MDEIADLLKWRGLRLMMNKRTLYVDVAGQFVIAERNKQTKAYLKFGDAWSEFVRII